MPLLDFPDLHRRLGPAERLLGIDPGSRTIGLALSDVRRTIASPYGSLRRGRLREIAAAVLAIARQEGVGGLVVGLPLSMDGSFGPAAQAARDWALALSGATGLPAAMWDERLSTVAANRMLVQAADLSRRKRQQVVDRTAASWMLQSAMNSLGESRQ
jgi:putative Holliday junction resolvase